jgi:hypothetical protein
MDKGMDEAGKTGSGLNQSGSCLVGVAAAEEGRVPVGFGDTRFYSLRFHLPLLILLLLSPLTHAAGNGLREFSGEIQVSYYFADGKVSYSTNPRFTMVTDNTHFRIRLEKPGENMATDYREVAWDGTNCYYMEALPAYIREQLQKGRNVGSNVGSAIITAIPVPQFSGISESAGVLWCAYIAPFYLKQSSLNSRVHVPFSTGMLNDGMPAGPDTFTMRPALWHYSPDRDYFDELCYVADVRQPFTNVVYRSTQWTNVGGVQVPCSGVSTSFVRNGSSVYKIAEFNFTLHLAGESKAGSKPFQPEIPGLTLVTEERFNSATTDLHFNYTIDSSWPSVETVKSLPQYSTGAAAAKFIISKQGNAPSLREVPIYTKVAFLIFLAAPAAYLFTKRYAKRDGKPVV